MTYPGTTREIRFGDVVQIVETILGGQHEKRYLIGRITAQSGTNENRFFVKFGDDKELSFTADQFQWVGSPRTR